MSDVKTCNKNIKKIIIVIEQVIKMDLNKISNFIKTKRKELGLTQEELAEKLFITEKAISRWETGRGTPDISLLIPLSKELKIEVYELLNGEEQKKNSNEVEQVIRYNEIRKKRKNNFLFKIIICCYILSRSEERRVGKECM